MASSAKRTCSELRSASLYTATVFTPSSLQAQITRNAISPRLAINIFLNIILSCAPNRRLVLWPKPLLCSCYPRLGAPVGLAANLAICVDGLRKEPARTPPAGRYSPVLSQLRLKHRTQSHS